MQNLAKTLILSSNKDSSFKAILNLNSNESSLIRFFNYKNPSKTLALGIKQNSKVIKIPLKVENSKSLFSLQNKVDFSKNLMCAVVDVTNPFCPEIILSGSGNSVMENSHIEGAFVTKKPEDTSVLYEKDSQEKIDDLIDENLRDDMTTTYFDTCANCKYRQAFYNEGECCCNKSKTSDNNKESKVETNTLNDDNSNLKNDEENKREEIKNFYEQVKPQLDALFSKYEEYTLLENIIPNSKWTKVVYDKNGEYYVLGLIYNEIGEVLYICYGMPASSPDIPPEDLEEYAGWFPKDAQNPKGEGYFIVCQDGVTGKTLKLDLV